MKRNIGVYYNVQFNDPVCGRDMWRLAEKGIFTSFVDAKDYYYARKRSDPNREWRIEKCVRTVVYP